MSSPERTVLTRQSIFDDEPMMHSPPPIQYNKKSIFDDDDDEDEEEHQEEQIEDDEVGDYYDPSTSWLSHIYSDSNSSNDSSRTSTPPTPEEHEDSDDEDDEENRAPRFWNIQNKQQEKKTRRILPQEEDNTIINERLPLREIRFDDFNNDDEDNTHTKKKFVTSNGKPHKMRFMRTLSPPRYAKRKGDLL
jgi:hypothetical protein